MPITEQNRLARIDEAKMYLRLAKETEGKARLSNLSNLNKKRTQYITWNPCTGEGCASDNMFVVIHVSWEEFGTSKEEYALLKAKGHLEQAKAEMAAIVNNNNMTDAQFRQNYDTSTFRKVKGLTSKWEGYLPQDDPAMNALIDHSNNSPKPGGYKSYYLKYHKLLQKVTI